MLEKFLGNLKNWKPIPLCWFFKKRGWKIPKYLAWLIGHPGIENFTTYDEEDPNGHISKTADRVTFSGLTRNEDAWVVKDKGVDHFDGDFEHWVDVKVTGASSLGLVFIWSLANLVDDWKGIDDGNGDELGIFFFYNGEDYLFEMYEIDGGVQYGPSYYYISVNTTYYLKIVRDESIGTYGRLYCYIYPTAADREAGTNLLASPYLDLHSSKKDFRYIYATQSLNSGQADRSLSGYVENLDLQVIVEKSVSDSGQGQESISKTNQIKVEDKNLPSVSYF